MKNNNKIIILLLIMLVFAMVTIGCENNSIENNNLEPTTNNENTNNNSSDSELNNTSLEENNNEEANEEANEEISEDFDDGLRKRADIADEYKWELTKIYENTESFKKDIKIVENSFSTFDKLESTFLNSYENFYSVLDLYQTVRRKTDTLFVYASLQSHTDTRNADFSDLEEIATQVDTDLGKATSFLWPSIANLDKDTLDEYMSNSEMKEYVSFINEIISQKDHILSISEEELLAEAQILFEIPESIYDSYNYLTDLSEYLPQPDWSKFWTGNREDKKDALEAYYSKNSIGNNLLAEIYESEIKKNAFFAKARNYNSALESALEADGVTIDEYNIFFDITHKNLDKLHKWIAIKKDILNIDDKLHIYDLYTPLIDQPFAYTDYENGKEIIYNALAPLGDKYIEDLKVAFDSRWADVYPTSGKYEGGYQWGTYDTDPFILLNFNDSMTDVSTVAHEMGHGLNAKYTNETQGYFSSAVPIFNAEIASTANETLVFEYQVANAKNKQDKLRSLLNYIELIENTIFTQLIYADFEKRVYEAYEKGEPLDADLFNSIMEDVFTEYYGPDFEIDDFVTYQWSEIPHFYNAFYVYKYATGLSAGLTFADNVLNGTEDDLNKYLTFLSTGSSKPSLDLLRDAGVDFSTGEPLQRAFDRFEKLIDEFYDTLNSDTK